MSCAPTTLGENATNKKLRDLALYIHRQKAHDGNSFALACECTLIVAKFVLQHEGFAGNEFFTIVYIGNLCAVHRPGAERFPKVTYCILLN